MEYEKYWKNRFTQLLYATIEGGEEENKHKNRR